MLQGGLDDGHGLSCISPPFSPSFHLLCHSLVRCVLAGVSRARPGGGGALRKNGLCCTVLPRCPHFLLSSSGLQEDARADVVDCVVRDIQNSQCLLNVEYAGPTCPHVTIQFGDTKDDVGLGLVKEGLVMVDVRKEKHLQKMVGGDANVNAGRPGPRPSPAPSA